MTVFLIPMTQESGQIASWFELDLNCLKHQSKSEVRTVLRQIPECFLFRILSGSNEREFNKIVRSASAGQWKKMIHALKGNKDLYDRFGRVAEDSIFR